jgi:hypothetical protein
MLLRERPTVTSATRRTKVVGRRINNTSRGSKVSKPSKLPRHKSSPTVEDEDDGDEDVAMEEPEPEEDAIREEATRYEEIADGI